MNRESMLVLRTVLNTIDPLPICNIVVLRSNRVLHIRMQRMNTTKHVYVFVVNPLQYFYEFVCVRLL